MFGFARRVLKMAVPMTLLIAATAKPILNLQDRNSQQDQQNSNSFHFQTPVNFQANQISALSVQNKQKNEQENEKHSQPQQEIKEQNDKVQNFETKKMKQEPSKDKGGQSALSTVRQNQAQVSSKIPEQFIKYLELYDLNIIVKDSPDKNIKIMNKYGDVAEFDWVKEKKQQILFQVSNFVRGVRVIESLEEVKQLLSQLKEDQFIVASYIPDELEYNKLTQPKNMYDTFSGNRKLNIKELNQNFRHLKYQSSSEKNAFVLINNEEIAKYMRMNINKIDNQYIYYRTSFNNGMETSCLLQNKKYTIKTISSNSKIQESTISKGLYPYINEINFDRDMYNLLRSLSLKKDPRKLLIISPRQKRQQFIQQIKSILLKTGKIMKDDVVIIFTQNQNLLRKYFQIAPDDFVTVRLIDPLKKQPPILNIPQYSSDKIFLSRSIISGPFTVQNLCNSIRNRSKGLSQEYYQRKRDLKTIESIISLSQQLKDPTVVLHWKHGCKGCELTGVYLEKINQILRGLNQENQYKYQIQIPQKMKCVEFRRYNILNEQDRESPEDNVTPKVFLHSKGKITDLEIGRIIGKISEINHKNEEEVHQSIMKEIISAIEKNIKQQLV